MPIKADQYCNLFQFTATESAANTLTFGEINLGLTIFQKVGIVINRVLVEWSSDLISDLNQDADQLQVAITQSDQISDLSITQNAVVWKDKIHLSLQDATSFNTLVDLMHVTDFSTLPGGGELIAPRPLYWGIRGTGLSAVRATTVRMWFTIVELKTEEYFEILESRRFFG